MTKAGKIIELTQTGKATTSHSTFSKSGQYFAYTTSDAVKLLKWSKAFRKWKEMKTFEFKDVTEISFSSDEKLLAIGNRKGTIKLQNIISSKVLLDKTIHKSPISSLMFNNKNSQLITASLDNTVKLYDLLQLKRETHKPIAEQKPIDPFNLLGHSSWVWDVTFDQEQNYVYAISDDKTIRKWPTHIDELYKNLLELREILREEEEKKKKK
jgi:WD40 repeat protein